MPALCKEKPIRRATNTLLASIIVLGMLSGMLFFGRGVIAAQLDEWHILPKPEPFTELYFTDYRALPATVAPGSQQQVSLTLHNHEHRTTTYHYRIIATAPNAGEQVIEEGECTAEHDRTCVVATPFTVPPLGPRVMLRAAITYNGRAYDQAEPHEQTQSIHHWFILDAQTKGSG